MADISTSNIDSGSKSPRLARAQLKDLIDRVNAYAVEFLSPFLAAGNGARNQNNASGDAAHLFEVTNDNSAYQVLRFNSYGVSAFGNNVHWCRYNGTLASPTAIGSGAYLMSMGFRGWDGSGVLSQSAAAFQVLTTEAWNSGAHGLKFDFEVSKSGSATRLPAMQIYAGSTDGVILQLGDGTSLLSRVLNNSTTGGLQFHGSSDQNGSQSIWYGSAHATVANNALHRADVHRWESVGATEYMRLDSSGRLGVGTASPHASAALDVQSTARGVRFPNVTTTQKNAISSPGAGLVVFDTTLGKLCVYTGSAWQTMTSV